MVVYGLDYCMIRAFLGEAEHLLAVYHAPGWCAVESHALPFLGASLEQGWILEQLGVLKLCFRLTASPCCKCPPLSEALPDA